MPAALGATALAALAVGALAVRTAGIYFIMLTLAFAQMLYFLFHDWKALGGSDGLYIAVRPTAELFGATLVNFNHRPSLFYVVLAAMVGIYLLIGVLMRAPFGKVISGIRVNEHRMRALGYNTYRYKLATFVIAGAIAGFAGFFYATQNTYVNPALMGWRESGIVLMMVILGGMRIAARPHPRRLRPRPRRGSVPAHHRALAAAGRLLRDRGGAAAAQRPRRPVRTPQYPPQAGAGRWLTSPWRRPR